MDPALRTIYAVSEFAEILRALLEEQVGRVWVEGEISNFSRPASGHWYFTLKDARAQLRCAMFRGQNFHVRPQPRDGDRVLVRAQASLYAGRGDLQLICEHLEPAGEGALLRAFEELKKRLAAEGLFDDSRKRPIPAMPRRIGLITSATGAAVRDVIAALTRRFPLVPVFLWPVPVQGAAAAPAIIRALAGLPSRSGADVVLLVRGGGSLEDLWSFNEESVARAIRACSVPVVTGVGHEIDFTIADFAADLRAPTPTAAAELVSPDRASLSGRRRSLEDALARCAVRGLRERREALQRLDTRLAALHPSRSLQLRAQRLDDVEQRLQGSMLRRLDERRARLSAALRDFARGDPRRRLAVDAIRLDSLKDRLNRAARQTLESAGLRLRHAVVVLRTMNPQAVLERGYAIARRDGHVLRQPGELAPGDAFELLLAGGALTATKTSD